MLTKTYLLLLVLIFCWTANILFTKIGLQYMSPGLFTFLRLSLGAMVMFVFLGLRRKLIIPKWKDLPLIFSIGLAQMGIFQVLLTLGMRYVHAGRASVLVYSTPLWVTPVAVLLFQEKLSHLKILGFILGVGGLFLLLNPVQWSDIDFDTLISYGLLLSASFFWAIAILHARFGKWHRSPIELIPWQLLVSIIPPACLLYFMPDSAQQEIQWSNSLIAIILYNGVVATAFGYWASLVVSKQLSVTITSLSMLAVPMLSIIFSILFLEEPFTINSIVSVILVFGGLGFIVLEGLLAKRWSRVKLLA